MKSNGYKIICELFSTIKSEKILKSYPLLNLSIYQNSKLITKRYLVARFSITNKKLVFDRLSSVNIVPIIMDIEGYPQHVKTMWKSQKAFEIPYKFLKSISFISEEKTMVIETLIEGTTIFFRTSNINRDSKEIINLIQKYSK